MKSLEKLFKLADKFEKNLKVWAQVHGFSAQAGDFQDALKAAKLWDYNDIASSLNSFLNKIDYQSKFDTDIMVDKNGAVKIIVKGNDPKNPKVQNFLQTVVAPKMASVFKSKSLKPTDSMLVPWLSQAG